MWSPRAIAAHPARPFVYVATSDDGVLTYVANERTSALTQVGSTVAGSDSIAVHPSGRFAYATATGATPGVFGYTVDGNGTLTPIANPVATGSGPVAVAIDPAGRFAYVANQVSSSISAYSIDVTTGVLTQASGSPVITAVGARALAIDPTSAFLYVACIGDPTNTGALVGYAIDGETGALTQIPGSPFLTHYSLAVGIDRSGRFAYEVGGLDATRVRAELRSFTIGGAGSLTEIPGSRLLLASAALGVALTR